MRTGISGSLNCAQADTGAAWFSRVEPSARLSRESTVTHRQPCPPIGQFSRDWPITRPSEIADIHAESADLS